MILHLHRLILNFIYIYTPGDSEVHTASYLSTDAAEVCLTAVLLVHSGSHISCHKRCSYPTTTKFTTQWSTWNTTLLEKRAQNIIVHFGVAATCVPQPGTCSSIPATGDDHVVRLQISSPGKAKIAIQCWNTVWTHLLVDAGFDCQLRKLESVMPPETQFKWGLGWTISVPADTLKPHSRWMQNECRGPVSLISVGNFEVQCNFKLKWEIGEQWDRFCFCSIVVHLQ